MKRWLLIVGGSIGGIIVFFVLGALLVPDMPSSQSAVAPPAPAPLDLWQYDHTPAWAARDDAPESIKDFEKSHMPGLRENIGMYPKVGSHRHGGRSRSCSEFDWTRMDLRLNRLRVDGRRHSKARDPWAFGPGDRRSLAGNESSPPQRRAVGAGMMAIAAIDIALWDLKAKLLDVSLVASYACSKTMPTPARASHGR